MSASAVSSPVQTPIPTDSAGLPAAPATPLITIGALLDQVLLLLDKPIVQSDPQLSALLFEKSNIYASLNTQSPLSQDDLSFHNRIVRLLDTDGKVRAAIKKQLFPSPQANPNAGFEADKKTVIAHPSPSNEADKKHASAKGPSPMAAAQSSISEMVEKLDHAKLAAEAKTRSAKLTEEVKNLIEMEPFASPVHEAAARGENAKIWDLLSRGGKELLEKEDRNGATPLVIAAVFGQLEVCTSLLQMGAGILIKSKRKRLYEESASESRPFPQSYLVYDPTSMNILHFASLGGNPKVVELFCHHKPLLNAKARCDQLYNEYTPLENGAKWGQEAACEALLQAGADVGDALSIACTENHVGVVRLLERYKKLRFKTGENLVACAANNGSAEICNILLKAGAPGVEGALHLACRRGLAKLLPVLIPYTDSLELTVEGPCFEKELEGATPLICAAFNGDAEACQILINAGANVMAKNKAGDTALDIACKKKKESVIQVLRQALKK